MIEYGLIERLLALIALIAALYGIRAAIHAWQARRVAQLHEASLFAGVIPAGKPAIIAFSTPTCNDCRVLQKPALERLSASLGQHVSIQMISALDHHELTDQLGILTVPATAIVDARGSLQRINLGYTDEHQLAAQIQHIAFGNAGACAPR
ncbi:MAG TPA: thioredoxin family protein [Roseiflexaceae bacterium]|nr:thioredoxin family protein [Roseiflexaceae bacterium]